MHTALRDRLTYPAGIAPGFDPSHVAARSTLFSAVSYGTSNLINILTGQPGVPVDNGFGPPTAIVDHAGPGIDLINGNATQFPGFYTTPPTWQTVGLIMTTPDASVINNPGVFHPVFSNGAPSTGNEFCLCLFQPNGPAWNSWGGSSGCNTNIPMPGDTPIFLASSFNIATGEMLAVMTNLRTGQIFFDQAIGVVGGSYTPSDGTLHIGAFNRNSGRSVAAVMHSADKVSRSQMLAWAEDPWSFWYPRVEPKFLVGTIGAAAFLAAWAANSNSIIGAGARTL
jgi:hypothetical protein